jgi:hypothetical protein
MKLRVLSETQMKISDVMEATFDRALSDPAIKGSYAFNNLAGGRLVFISPAGTKMGVLGAWNMYGDSPFVFGLSVSHDAKEAYDLPAEILETSKHVEYDLRSPEDLTDMEDRIRRYMIEFEKRNKA